MKKPTKEQLQITLGIFLVAIGIFIIAKVSREKTPAVKDPEKFATINNLIDPEHHFLPPFPTGSYDEGSKYTKTVPILMYHHIRDFDDPKNRIDTNLSVSPTKFKQEVDWLKNAGYKTIDFEDLFSGHVSEKSIILTFDDGFSDNYDAYKILKDNGQKGTFFVVSGSIGAGSHMSKDQLIEMENNDMEIESHTVNHLDLTKLNEANLNYQLVSGKNDLETMLDRKIDFLCYPSGRYNDKVIDATRKAGYAAAVTTNFSAKDGNNFTLPRVRMNHDDRVGSLGTRIDSFMIRNEKNKWNFGY